ncbi:MAG TPA: AarF/UbiB family protein [Gemmataceae bacterium]|nr:AarF/UbiB family protein [Gemmataceae bacterium]
MAIWSHARRVAKVGAVLARHGLAHAAGPRLRHWPRLARLLPAADLPGPQRLRVVLEELGGTFIKFGQMLALQPDIVSLEYCNALFDLLDRVAPFAPEEVERTFVEELGRPPQELFERFEPRPIAAASIGQVHVAWLKGRKVAVKVQRPTVERDFGGDIRLMAALLALIRRLRLRRLEWMAEPLSEFIAWTREELDYRHEARYMERLRANARDNPHERIPAVYGEYTTRRTLVMEFFDGVPVLDYLRALERNDKRVFGRLKEIGFEPDEFARHLIENFLGDAFRHGMFHADLHPGNLMILPGNVIGYIDFGITGVLSGYSRRHLIAMTLAYTRADLSGMSGSFLKVSAAGEGADLDAFREGLKRFADDWYELRGRDRRLRKNFTLVMLDMLRLSRRTQVWPERDVIKYIRSAIASDGLITRFAPAFNVGQYLERVCNRHLKWRSLGELLSYEAALGWSAAADGLLRDGALRGTGALRRLAAGELPARAEAGPPAGGDAAARRAVGLGATVFGAALLLVLTGARPPLGANLFTGGALVAAAAALLLLRTVCRLA